MICIKCTCDAKDCKCKYPKRITKLEYTKKYWIKN
jgi:hypothetical protein